MAVLVLTATRRLSRLLLGVSMTLVGLPTLSWAADSTPIAQSTSVTHQKSCTEHSALDSVEGKQSRCQSREPTNLAKLPNELAFTAPLPRAIPPSESFTSPLPLADAPAPDDWTDSSVQRVDVDPAIIEGSPVLQRWLEEVPDLAVDIHHDPAFRTRVRVGYAEFPSTDNTGGVYVGVQDVFVGRTPLTLSAEYAVNGRGDRQVIGADAQYYLLPLGWYGNVAPVIGYRDIQTPEFAADGLNLGLRVILIPSRAGTADLSVTQSWVAPGTDREVGLTTFSAGYAIAEDLRIGTDIQIQNTRRRQESRVGVLLEWLL